jgi:5S rRNA maturation endonuclease (ribonuclease M5)
VINLPRRANPRPTRRGAGKLDLYSSWIKTLKNASVGRVVLVKTKKQKEILESLKVKNVIAYLQMRPDFKLVDYLGRKNKEVILLFSTDRPNNSLCAKLTGVLKQHKIKTITRFRKVLFGCEQKDLSGLLTYLYKHVADSPRKRAGVSY